MFKRSVGHYRPACNGRCLLLDHTADPSAMNLFHTSFSMIVLPCVLWFVFAVGALPVWGAFFGSLIVGGLTVSACTCLTLCYVTEPGILHFKEVEETEEGSETTYKKFVLLLDGRETALEVKRAKICRQTNTAIENFDHYCPWTGNAVGKRNYPYFFGFVTSTTVLSLAVLAFTIWGIFATSTALGIDVPEYIALGSQSPSNIVQVMLCVYASITFLALIGLNGYHCFLVADNVTTNERLRGTYFGKTNPHDKGCCGNAQAILCHPTVESRVKEGEGMTNPLLIEPGQPLVSHA